MNLATVFMGCTNMANGRNALNIPQYNNMHKIRYNQNLDFFFVCIFFANILASSHDTPQALPVCFPPPSPVVFSVTKNNSE